MRGRAIVASAFVLAVTSVLGVDPAVSGAGAAATSCDRLMWSGTLDDTAHVFIADVDGTNRIDATPIPLAQLSSNIEVQWSPDGTQVVWAALENGIGSRVIYVADADGSNKLKISSLDEPALTGNETPQWSSDGTRVVWVGEHPDDGTHVWAADPDGANRVNVSDLGGDGPDGSTGPQWSPDGSRIAWAADDPDDTEFKQIWVADVDGQNRLAISHVGEGMDPLYSSNPQWSPDGLRIVWDGFASGASERDIYVADSDGQNRVAIADVDGNLSWNGRPEWSPDGTKILWESELGIYTAEPDGINRVLVSDVGIDPDPTGNQSPQWSPDGFQLAWHGVDDGIEQIFAADADGQNRFVLSDTGVAVSPTSNRRPQWSPDGSRVAWSGWSEASVTHIYVVDIDGSNRTVISHGGDDPYGNRWAAWSPDGSQIAWEGGMIPFDRQVYSASSDGSNRAMISTPPDDGYSPEWSPDGTQIAWSGGEVLRSIIVAGTAGESAIDVSGVGPDPDPVGNASVAWSPSSRLLAWTAVADAGVYSGIYVADRNGENRLEVSSVGSGPTAQAHWDPVWSADRERLAWVGTTEYVNEFNEYIGDDSWIFVADSDGDQRVDLSSIGEDPDPEDNLQPAWSPDGSRIAWAGMVEDEYQIVIADSDGENRIVISQLDEDPDPTGNTQPAWSPDGTRLAWRGTQDSDQYIFVADSDGSNRTRISDIGPTPYPTSSSDPLWRPRAGTITMSTTIEDLTVGEYAAVDLMVASDCRHGSVVVQQLDLPCIKEPEVLVDAGTVNNGIWTIDVLDSTATATVSGFVTSGGFCSLEAVVVTALPALNELSGVEASGFSAWDCPTGTLQFDDLDVGSTAYEAVVCLYTLGVTTGTTETSYSPDDLVTRQQMALFMKRLYESMTSSVCSIQATPFVDVAVGTSVADSIACIYGIGVTTGTTTTTYEPTEPVTRAQMAVFISRLWAAIQGAAAPILATPFADLDGSTFAIDDIGRIYGLGVTTGATETTYDPTGFVTRYQMALFLARLYEARPLG